MKRISMVFIVSIVLTVVAGLLLVHRAHRIKEAAMPGVLSIAMSADYPPFSFFDAAQAPAGFDIDVIKEVAKKLNKEFVVHNVPFELLLSKVNNGDYMLAIGGITATKQRREKALFSNPYYEHDTLVILMPVQSNKITTIRDLSGKRIAVVTGSTAAEYLKNISDIIVVLVPSIQDCVLALKAGDSDAALLTAQTVKPLLTQYGALNFALFPIVDAEESYAIAIDPAYTVLQREINNALGELVESGVINTLKLKWGLQ
jgi:ABC-type amino acid transport substrate-binding protein